MNSSFRSSILFAAFALPAAFAQEAPAPPSIEYGRLTVTGFDLREARFAPPFRTWEAGKETLHRGGWQVVVHGDRFPVRALDPILWVGDVAIRNYEREATADGDSLRFCITDPALLRAERELTLIYGEDERTRTRLLERLDPEKLQRLPAAERAELGLADLEGVTLQPVGVDGKVSGSGRIAGGRIVLALRLQDGRLGSVLREVSLAGGDARGSSGRFAAELGLLPEAATHVVALFLSSEAEVRAGVELARLPKGVELLDSKPVRRK